MPRVRETAAKSAPTVEQLRAEFARNRAACVKRGHKLEDVKAAISHLVHEISDGEDVTPEMWVQASRQVLGNTYTDHELGY